MYEIEVHDLDDIFDELPEADDEPKANADHNAIHYDIETGPRPWAEIECFYTPPEPLPPWSESMVAYGNTKDPDKRATKRQEVFTAYQQKLLDEAEAREQHRLEWYANAALSPLTGCVMAIGTLNGGMPFIYNNNEAAAIEHFWGLVEGVIQNGGRLIGFNSNYFDLPFLIRRSWALGVEVPSTIQRGRYFHPALVDLLDVWRCGGREFISLDALGRFFGVGQKPDGIGGGDFARLYLGTPEEKKQALEYLENDLRLTQAVARKMGVC